MTLDDLTPREQEVARMVGEGLDYAEIAGRLKNLRSYKPCQVSTRTVRHHVENIAQRLGVNGSPYRAVMRWVLKQAA